MKTTYKSRKPRLSRKTSRKKSIRRSRKRISCKKSIRRSRKRISRKKSIRRSRKPISPKKSRKKSVNSSRLYKVKGGVGPMRKHGNKTSQRERTHPYSQEIDITNIKSSLIKELKDLPYQAIEIIGKNILKQPNGMETFDILLNIHIPSFDIIKGLISARKKISLCLLNTRLWLDVTISMGFNDYETNAIWPESIIEYQRNVIDNCLYTSRVHDLIDCSRGKLNDMVISIEGIIMANKLLHRLAKRVSEDYDRAVRSGKEKEKYDYELAFLSGKQPEKDKFVLSNENLKGVISLCMEDRPILKTELIEQKKILMKTIKYWDTRKVTNMSFLFFHIERSKEITVDLTYWDVSKVTNMIRMFSKNLSQSPDNVSKIIFTGLTNWNTCRVKSMNYMIDSNTSFNSTISNWDVSSVTNMSGMFNCATAFNQPLEWDTSQVTNMTEMFKGATAFNQLLEWDTSRVTNMTEMFDNSSAARLNRRY